MADNVRQHLQDTCIQAARRPPVPKANASTAQTKPAVAEVDDEDDCSGGVLLLSSKAYVPPSGSVKAAPQKAVSLIKYQAGPDRTPPKVVEPSLPTRTRAPFTPTYIIAKGKKVPQPGAAKLKANAGLDEWLEAAKKNKYLPERAIKQLCEMNKELLMEGELITRRFLST